MIFKNDGGTVLKKIFAFLLVISLLFTFASCGQKTNEDVQETTSETAAAEENSSYYYPATEYTVTDTTVPETTAAETTITTTAAENTTAATTTAVTEPATEAPTMPAPTSPAAPEILDFNIVKFDFGSADPDPSKWSMQQIIDCYKSGMVMEDHNGVKTDQSFELTGDLPGKAAILREPVKLAMRLAAQPFEALPGGYWDIQVSDLKSADAHKEGDYVVINLYPNDQVDGPNGNEHEGSVGHVVNVVQGIDGFIGYVEDNFSVLNAKYDADSVVLTYKEAYAKNVRINTVTGKMESGTWGYDLDIYLDHCSMAGVEFNNFTTSVRWKCWYPV